MKVIRLLFLFFLLQGSTPLPFTNSITLFMKAGSAENSSPDFANKPFLVEINELCPPDQTLAGLDLPYGQADTEDPTSLDAGLPVGTNFDLMVSGRSALFPQPEQWYNFFRQFSIPPPEQA